MKSLCLMIARFALSAWVGAAALFVITGVREVTSPKIASPIRDALVTIRFPPYYVCGFVLVAVTLICLTLARRHETVRPRLMRFCLSTLGLILILMLIDYFAIYRPLAAMVTPPGKPRPAGFRTFHHASMWINMAHVGLSLVVALLICGPVARRRVLK